MLLIILFTIIDVVYGDVMVLMRFCLILHYRRVRTNQGVILSVRQIFNVIVYGRLCGKKVGDIIPNPYLPLLSWRQQYF